MAYEFEPDYDDRKTYGDGMWWGGLLIGMVIGAFVATVAISILLTYGP